MPDPSTFTTVINSYLPEPHASLLNGILFGVSLKTSKVFYEQLKTAGLLHLVVLSGMNITLLAAMLLPLTRYFSKIVSIVIIILIIIIFVIFVHPQAPIVRAAFMGILTFVAIIYGRKTSALYLLFLSAIFIAIVSPRWLTTVSFQLSYAATLSLILFNTQKPFHISQDVKGWKRRWIELRHGLYEEFGTSVAAQILSAPVIFFYFKQVSLVSPLANVAVAWTVGPLMVFGFLTAFLGKIYYPLGLPFAGVCYVLLSYMVWMINLLSRLPYAMIKF